MSCEKTFGSLRKAKSTSCNSMKSFKLKRFRFSPSRFQVRSFKTVFCEESAGLVTVIEARSGALEAST